MRSKQIIALITFLACFGLSTLLVGLLVDKTAEVNDLYQVVTVKQQSDNDVSEKIVALLQQDEENGQNRSVSVYSFQGEENSFSMLAAESKITSEYVRNSGSIDDSGLPRDFQIAWRKHMKAWADYADFLRKAEKAGASAESICAFETQYNRDINSTWGEVLRLAANYDVDFSN